MHWLMNTESGFCLIAVTVMVAYVVMARHLFKTWGEKAAKQMRANYKASQEGTN